MSKYPRNCLECGQRWEAKRQDAKFCGSKCRSTNWNRKKKAERSSKRLRTNADVLETIWQETNKLAETLKNFPDKPYEDEKALKNVYHDRKDKNRDSWSWAYPASMLRRLGYTGVLPQEGEIIVAGKYALKESGNAKHQRELGLSVSYLVKPIDKAILRQLEA